MIIRKQNEEGYYIAEDMTGQVAEVCLDEGKVNNLMVMVTPGLSIYKVIFRKRRDMGSDQEESYLFAHTIEEAKVRFRLGCRKYTLIKVRKLWT